MITCDHYNRIRFQFLGIPPKGEQVYLVLADHCIRSVSNF